MHYERSDANAILPLLASIGREIQERSDRLDQLETSIEEQSSMPAPDPEELHRLLAEAATQRRGLRLAKQELERLGCSVVGMEPLTFRIPGRVGRAKHSFVWRTGDPVLR